MSKNSTWKQSKNRRRYTMSMVFEQIYGRKYDRYQDCRITNQFAKVLAYYSSKIQKSGSIMNKNYSKTIYTISPKRIKKPPYSLKLRVEWLAEQGLIPNGNNMQLPKDDLKPGHARNPRTDENMRKRREEARRIYEERYADRKH